MSRSTGRHAKDHRCSTDCTCKAVAVAERAVYARHMFVRPECRDKRGLHLRGVALFFGAAASSLCALAVSASCGCAPTGSDISSAKPLSPMPWCRGAALQQAPTNGEAASGSLSAGQR